VAVMTSAQLVTAGGGGPMMDRAPPPPRRLLPKSASSSALSSLDRRRDRRASTTLGPAAAGDPWSRRPPTARDTGGGRPSDVGSALSTTAEMTGAGYGHRPPKPHRGLRRRTIPINQWRRQGGRGE